MYKPSAYTNWRARKRRVLFAFSFDVCSRSVRTPFEHRSMVVLGAFCVRSNTFAGFSLLEFRYGNRVNRRAGILARARAAYAEFGFVLGRFDDTNHPLAGERQQ